MEGQTIMNMNCICKLKTSNIAKPKCGIRKPMESANGCIAPCKMNSMPLHSAKISITAWRCYKRTSMNGCNTITTKDHTVAGTVTAKLQWKRFYNLLP